MKIWKSYRREKTIEASSFNLYQPENRPILLPAASQASTVPYYSTALIISKNCHILSSFNVNK